MSELKKWAKIRRSKADGTDLPIKNLKKEIEKLIADGYMVDNKLTYEKCDTN